jgi:RNA polymerase sigma-70 factor (ECF subfamily)
VEDAALLARIAHGDERALETLYERFAGAVYGIALRVTRAERFAEEVKQDVFMAVWRDPGRFDTSRGSLGPWLLTMARNKAIDLVRREETVRRRTADVDLELTEAADDVHDEVWQTLRRERIQSSLARLPEEQRRAVHLAFIRGLTHVEVAAAEGIPLGTAKTRIRAALLKMRDDIGSALAADLAGGQ